MADLEGNLMTTHPAKVQYFKTKSIKINHFAYLQELQGIFIMSSLVEIILTEYIKC